MTVPSAGWRAFIDLARALGCSGVEMRNDLAAPMFGGDAPEDVATYARDRGIVIHALAEVYAFNDGTKNVMGKVRDLADLARRSGATAIVLIPRKDGPEVSFDQLCAALDKIGGILAEAGVRGLVEPLGFPTSTLRDFDAARAAIRETHGASRFGIVHDTFHHHLSGAARISSDLVEMVHISGVTSQAPAEMLDDRDRGLLDGDDRLGSIAQIEALRAQGYSGPVSMEAFAPSVHDLRKPEVALRATFDFIHTSLKAHAA
ncbi:MAG: TIM barrel protein [Silicimonas sp.]|nr:TIM barrel protein [Silicimonas sp.]